MTETTTPDLRALRELAEAAIESPAWQSLFVVGGRRAGKTALCEFLTTANPTAVLALLDRLEAAEAAVERVRALLGEPVGPLLDTFARNKIRAALDAD